MVVAESELGGHGRGDRDGRRGEQRRRPARCDAGGHGRSERDPRVAGVGMDDGKLPPPPLAPSVLSSVTVSARRLGTQAQAGRGYRRRGMVRALGCRSTVPTARGERESSRTASANARQGAGEEKQRRRFQWSIISAPRNPTEGGWAMHVRAALALQVRKTYTAAFCPPPSYPGGRADGSAKPDCQHKAYVIRTWLRFARDGHSVPRIHSADSGDEREHGCSE